MARANREALWLLVVLPIPLAALLLAYLLSGQLGFGRPPPSYRWLETSALGVAIPIPPAWGEQIVHQSPTEVGAVYQGGKETITVTIFPAHDLVAATAEWCTVEAGQIGMAAQNLAVASCYYGGAGRQARATTVWVKEAQSAVTVRCGLVNSHVSDACKYVTTGMVFSPNE